MPFVKLAPLVNSSMSHRILFAAGREAGYVRNYLLIKAVSTLAEVTAITPDRPGSLSLNLLRVLRRLLPALRQPHDLVILGFYGHPLVPIVRRFTSAPMLFDAYVSTWDTLCFDRRKFTPTSVPGRVARWLDVTACRSADRILLDTQAHARFFSESFDLPADRVDYWYIGCDESIFFPRPRPPHTPHEALTVFFYGSYQPLHGVEVIVQAAVLLKEDSRLRFKLIGDGQTQQHAQHIAHQACLTNIEFLPPMPLTNLAAHTASSEICLAGPFGSTAKAQRVIPTKTAQFLAMSRPIIVADSPANRELLVHRQSAYLCDAGQPHSLAEAICTLADDETLRASLAQGGRQLFEDRLSLPRLISDLQPILDRALQARSTASNRSTHASH
jgi:glycosyltransferase involved in cell wall biosynthesis